MLSFQNYFDPKKAKILIDDFQILLGAPPDSVLLKLRGFRWFRYNNKWFQKVLDGFSQFQMVTYGFKWFSLLSSTPKCCNNKLSQTTLFRILQTIRNLTWNWEKRGTSNRKKQKIFDL